MQVLVFNCGSSSVKYQLINSVTAEKLQRGKVELDTGTEHAVQYALESVISEIGENTIDAVGHRVVHGGEHFKVPVLIDEEVVSTIERCAVDAPLHNPFNLLGIQVARKHFPGLPHVAVFDTSFHTSIPDRASLYAIDPALAERHRIRRFGFHGTSHQYVAHAAGEFLKTPVDELRLVTLHLGNGASACAVEFGRSVETSMGMTPLEGLVMGTRSGDIDAGAVLALLRSGDYTIDQIDDLLNRQSGLLGVSGVSNDLRKIEESAESGDKQAQLAINLFAHRARKYIGAYAAVMGGLDGVVFTGGIGENSVAMRQRIVQRLEFLGLRLSEDRNRAVAAGSDQAVMEISESHSRIKVLVAKTDEGLMIAQQTMRIANEENLLSASTEIPIAVSARHLHLTESTFAQLFGSGATPTKYRDISQPGQYACEERVNLIGPRNRIDGVRLLGPLRRVDQIEIARTDEFRLGIDAPIRDSGQVAGSAPITLEGPAGTVHLTEGLICARRHIHMHPDDAVRFGVADKDIVEVAITGGPRDLAFGDVLVRVSEKYKLEMHIDTDEANAAELSSDVAGELMVEPVAAACAVLKRTRG
jgi:acetate kinase